MGSRRPRRSHHRAEPDPLAAEFGARVRTLRYETGFSFDAFAEELGRSNVSELERGLLMPTLRTLARLAEVLEVEILDLVTTDKTPREQLVTATRGLSALQVRRLVREARLMGHAASAPTTAVLNPALTRAQRIPPKPRPATKPKAKKKQASEPPPRSKPTTRPPARGR